MAGVANIRVKYSAGIYLQIPNFQTPHHSYLQQVPLYTLQPTQARAVAGADTDIWTLLGAHGRQQSPRDTWHVTVMRTCVGCTRATATHTSQYPPHTRGEDYEVISRYESINWNQIMWRRRCEQQMHEIVFNICEVVHLSANFTPRCRNTFPNIWAANNLPICHWH